MSTSRTSTTPASGDKLDLRRILRSIRELKWVYVASFVIFMTLAIFYCIIKFPQYEVKSAILIEDPAGDAGISGAGGMATMMRTFSVGGFGGSSVNNELILINSHDVLMNTARVLGLNRNYIARDGLSKEMLYLDSPIAVEAPQEMMDTLTKGMKIVVDIDGGMADITVKRGLLGRVIGEARGASLPATVETSFGPIMVMKTSHFTGEPQRIEVTLGSYEAAADFLYTDIKVDTPDKLADAITFELLYPNRERGMAILNTLMAEYNLKRLNRKHATAMTQLEFLNARIDSIFNDLIESEQRVAEFKAKHLTVAVPAYGSTLLESSVATQTEMVKAEAEAAYYREVLAALSTPSRHDELLPVFDADAYPMIKDYNEMIIAKRQLSRSAKNDNPVLETMEKDLAEMRASVTRNVQGLLQNAQALLAAQRALIAQADNELSALPETEREYLPIARERALKSELYSYLASERENALLQIYNDETLGFIVDEAYTAIKPSKKKAILAIIACLFLAFFCPSILALWRTLRHRRVTDLMDLAKTGLEPDALTLDDTRPAANALRTKLMERGHSLRIFVSGPAAGRVISALAEAYGAIDRPTSLLSPADIGLDDDNDTILLPQFSRRMAEILDLDATEAVFVNVPNPERVGELAPIFDADDPSTILIPAYAPGELKIAEADKIAQAINPANIIFLLVK